VRVSTWTMASLAAVAVIAGCKSGSPDAASPIESIPARVVEARQITAQATSRATGALHAHESAALSAQVMGRVVKVLVREGDAVRAGQTLIVLDDATQHAATEQAAAGLLAAEQQQVAAEASANLASGTLARYRQLEAQKSVSPQEMDEVLRRAEAAQAQVNAIKAQAAAVRAQQSAARAMLGYTRILAPFAGVVTARFVDPGAMAAPGVPLLQMDGAGALELQAAVPESALTTLHKGMKLDVIVDSLQNTIVAGTLTEMLPAADAQSHTVQVKITLPVNRQLRAGLAASAMLPAGTRQVVTAPRSALVQRGSLPCVYVVNAGGIAQLRYVTLGNTSGASVEVLSGLSGSEKLVDQPADREISGKRVEVQP